MSIPIQSEVKRKDFAANPPKKLTKHTKGRNEPTYVACFQNSGLKIGRRAALRKDTPPVPSLIIWASGSDVRVPLRFSILGAPVSEGGGRSRLLPQRRPSDENNVTNAAVGRFEMSESSNNKNDYLAARSTYYVTRMHVSQARVITPPVNSSPGYLSPSSFWTSYPSKILAALHALQQRNHFHSIQLLALPP